MPLSNELARVFLGEDNFEQLDKRSEVVPARRAMEDDGLEEEIKRKTNLKLHRPKASRITYLKIMSTLNNSFRGGRYRSSRE